MVCIKLSSHFPFMHAENACILKTIHTFLQAVWAYPRFISSNQGKNAMQCIAFWLGIFLFKIEKALLQIFFYRIASRSVQSAFLQSKVNMHYIIFVMKILIKMKVHGSKSWNGVCVNKFYIFHKKIKCLSDVLTWAKTKFSLKSFVDFCKAALAKVD